MASPLAILLFGGSLAVAHDSSYVQVDGWLRIRCVLGACLHGVTCSGGWAVACAAKMQHCPTTALPQPTHTSHYPLQLPAGRLPRRQL